MEEENQINVVDLYNAFKKDKERAGGSPNIIRQNTVLGYDDSFGKSKYDDNIFPELALGTQNVQRDLNAFIKENRAQKQPWLNKAGAGLARIPLKVGTEIAKMPGYIGGAIGAAFAEDGKGWDTFVNNEWLNAIDNFSDAIHEEYLPVYVKKAVEEGDLLKNIFSIDFWATEGADGIGFMASMFVPGAAITKIGVGARLLKLVGKGAKGFNKLDDVANAITKYKINPEKINLYSQTIANTMFEAAAEAGSAGDAFETENIGKVNSGEWTEEEFNYRKAEVQSNIFKGNVLVLVGPNLVMSKMLWGKKLDKARPDVLDALGKPLAEATKASKRVDNIFNAFSDDIVPGILREGFFEEGLQSTMENYFVDKASQGESPSLLDIFSELPQAYLDNLRTTDGQKAIFLGAFLGGGMQAYQGIKERKADKASTSKVLKDIETLDSFYSVFNQEVYNEDGTLNGAKVVEKLQGLGVSDYLSDIYDKATAEGNQEVLDGLRAWAGGELTKSFLASGEKGLSALEEYLDKSSTMEELADRDQISKQEIIAPLKENARKLANDYQIFQEFSNSFLNLQNENATPEDIQLFMDKHLASKYLSQKNMSYFYDNKLKEVKKLRTNVLQSFDLQGDLVTEDEVLVNAEKDNIAIKEVNDKVRLYEKLQKDAKKEVNNFWKAGTHDALFEKFIGFSNDLRKATEEEEQNNLEKTTTKINEAATEEALDSIEVKGNPVTKKALNDLIKKRRKEIFKQTANTKENQVTTQATQQEAKKSEDDVIDSADRALGEQIANTMNPGESINIPMSMGNDYYTSSGTIVSVTDDFVEVFAEDRGETFKIPRKIKEKPSKNIVPPATENNVEGSEISDDLIPTENENKVDKNIETGKSGAKLISTDAPTGEPLPFMVGKPIIEYEKEPIDKVGLEVSFKLNEDPGKNKNLNRALQLFKNNDFSDIEFLIEYLPLDAVLPGNITAPTETKPSTVASVKVWEKSSKIMRTNIINLLVAGTPLESISTTVEGQYPGILRVDNLDANGNVRENSILDLHFLKGLTKEQKLVELQKRIGVITSRGALEILNGDVIELNKPKAAGELYLMIPQANGKPFPLKLNIKKISEPFADLLADLYTLRFSDKDIDKSTRISDINNPELKQKVDTLLTSSLGFIGKNKSDVTIKDLIDFLIWDRSTNIKTRVGFTGAGRGARKFQYGNPETNGATIENPADFDRNHFKEWLMSEKRYNINVHKKATQDNKASIALNRAYLDYILSNKIVNTNAIVGENNPTFQGYSNIYLDSHNVKSTSIPQKTETTEKIVEKEDIETTNQIADIERRRQEVLDSISFIEEEDIYTYDEFWSNTVGYLSPKDMLYNNKVRGSTKTKPGIKFKGNTKQDVIDKVNAKYDAEIEERAEEIWRNDVNEKGFPNRSLEEVVNELKKQESRDKKEEVPTKKLSKFEQVLAAQAKKARQEQKNLENIRKSQENFVPLHDKPNTTVKDKVDSLVESSKSVDKIEVTQEVINTLFKELTEKGLIKVGRAAQKLMSGDNKQKFENLKKLAEDNKLSVATILKKC